MGGGSDQRGGAGRQPKPLSQRQHGGPQQGPELHQGRTGKDRLEADCSAGAARFALRGGGSARGERSH
eukprot:1184179-Prorocentrum_minimum.AAC.7